MKAKPVGVVHKIRGWKEVYLRSRIVVQTVPLLLVRAYQEAEAKEGGGEEEGVGVENDEKEGETEVLILHPLVVRLKRFETKLHSLLTVINSSCVGCSLGISRGVLQPKLVPAITFPFLRGGPRSQEGSRTLTISLECAQQ